MIKDLFDMQTSIDELHLEADKQQFILGTLAELISDCRFFCKEHSAITQRIELIDTALGIAVDYSGKIGEHIGELSKANWKLYNEQAQESEAKDNAE